MALRATTPVLQADRFRALVYGDKGAGKTHFACSIPNAYYIDSEGVLKYKRFVKMLKENNSQSIALYELTDIIKEVKELLTVKHDFKTLVIDSITFPFNSLNNMEVERLVSKSPNTEGTEFGANMAKGKRLTFQLGMLLTRLDMNVIILAHEKTKYSQGEEIGKDPDVNEKMGYALGTQIHLRTMGASRKAYVDKSRYEELPNKKLLDFDDGYSVIKNLFGEEVFSRESTVETLATKEQIAEVKRLQLLLKYEEEKVQKWIMTKKASALSEVNTVDIETLINFLTNKVTKPQTNGDE